MRTERAPSSLATCPHCGTCLAVSVDPVSPPLAELERWRTLRDAAGITGRTVGELRRHVRDGRLAAKRGPRNAYLVRVADVDALADDLPTVETTAPDTTDEVLRLVSSS